MIPDLYKEAKQIISMGEAFSNASVLERMSVLDFERWLMYDIKPGAIEHSSPLQLANVRAQYIGLIRDKDAPAAKDLLTAVCRDIDQIKSVYYDLLQLRAGYDAELWQSLYSRLVMASLIPHNTQPPSRATHQTGLRSVEVKLTGLIAQVKRVERELLSDLQQIRSNRSMPYLFDSMIADSNAMFATNNSKGSISVKTFAAQYLAYCMAKEKESKLKGEQAIKHSALAA